MTFRAQRTAPTSSRRPVAPIHRGPQAVSQSASGSHTIHHAPNAALLIDFDNVTMGIRSDLQTELKNLLASDIIKGKVSVQRAYADWRRYPQYIVPLAESSIDMIMAPAYGSAKKNATDIRLAIDALELVFVRPEIGTFILLSGDSDFSSLVIKLKEYGKYVIGVGIRESSSDLLVMNCDEYYSYNSLAGLVKSGDEEVVKHDPWELVAEAVQRMKRNGDVMRADRLKQVMQQMDSSFDEKNVGKSKFSLFVAEAAKKGLLSLNKLENGQYEVDVPRPGGAAPAALPAPAAEASENGDVRRPRREARGRGRDRGRGGRGDKPAADAALSAGRTAEPAAAAPPLLAATPAAAAPSRASAAGEIADYEVAAAAGAPTVSAQLAAAETANTPPAKPATPALRGMSARGGRGPMGRAGAPPAHILNIGVVGTRSTARPQEAVVASSAEAEAPTGTIDSPAPSAVAEEAPLEKKPARGRTRGATRKSATTRKEAPAEADAATAEGPKAEAAQRAPRKRAARSGRKKAKSDASSGATPAASSGSEPE